jgi:isopropylmalate/homocitrate/citramalate synthase
MPLAGLSECVQVVEVGPRDGLQNEHGQVTTLDKVEFIDRLSAAGLPVIEIGAFVSPRWVPQMADTANVFRAITPRAGTRYPALVPNVVGLERARDAGVSEVAIFGAASETFSRKNINQSIEESFATFAQVCTRAREWGILVRGYLSTCFGCPYEGHVPVARVATLAARLLDLGVFEVALSDTIGVAHPGQVADVVSAVEKTVPSEHLALHFHDTRGAALANVLMALELGIVTFDASAGGLGGCPYAPGAMGNLATEDLIYMLNGLGIETGVDLDLLMAASDGIEQALGHNLPSRYRRAEHGRRSP